MTTGIRDRSPVLSAAVARHPARQHGHVRRTAASATIRAEGRINLMADQTAVEGAHMNRRECWCCGTIPEQLVHLGNHPEESLVAAYRPPWGRHHSAHKGLPAHYAHREAGQVMTTGHQLCELNQRLFWVSSVGVTRDIDSTASTTRSGLDPAKPSPYSLLSCADVGRSSAFRTARRGGAGCRGRQSGRSARATRPRFEPPYRRWIQDPPLTTRAPRRPARPTDRATVRRSWPVSRTPDPIPR